MGTKNDDRCLSKVDDDEPIFVLRAQDQNAVNTIFYWLSISLTGLNPAHLIEVQNTVADFYEWQNRNPSRVKAPD